MVTYFFFGPATCAILEDTHLTTVPSPLGELRVPLDG